MVSLNARGNAGHAKNEGSTILTGTKSAGQSGRGAQPLRATLLRCPCRDLSNFDLIATNVERSFARHEVGEQTKRHVDLVTSDSNLESTSDVACHAVKTGGQLDERLDTRASS